MENPNKYPSINQKINQSVRYYRVPSTADKSAVLNSLLTKIRSGQKPKTFGNHNVRQITWYAAAAAAVIFAVILFTGRDTFTNGTPQALSLRLDDSFRIILAEGSSVSRSRILKSDQVRLTGEAYFEVEKGNSFRVTTDAGNVKVLGTRFFVKEEGDDMEVRCYEGSVQVSRGKTAHTLQPGDKAVVIGKNMEMAALGEESFPPVALFQASYVDAEIGKVIADLENFFNLRIVRNFNEQRFYTGTFQTGSLDAALMFLCEPLGLKFSIENDRVNIQK